MIESLNLSIPRGAFLLSRKIFRPTTFFRLVEWFRNLEPQHDQLYLRSIFFRVESRQK